jgi:hypothetical protein
MTTGNLREPYENDKEPEPNMWETREGMMSEEDVRRLSEEKGKGEIGNVRADQTVEPGPNEGADPVQRPDIEGRI